MKRAPKKPKKLKFRSMAKLFDFVMENPALFTGASN